MEEMRSFQPFHSLKFCFLLCFSFSMSYGYECINSPKTGIRENCPSMFGNRYRIYCCEQMDGTVFCCDYDEYIRNRGKRRKIENVHKVISGRKIYYPWWLNLIMYIVPVMQVGLCIGCCVCTPCCKQRRRGFVYRIQEPGAIVNVQPYDPAPGIAPRSQGAMSVLPQPPACVPMQVPQPTSSSSPLVHNSSHAQYPTLPLDHATPFEEPPPPYSAVVGDMYFKHVP